MTFVQAEKVVACESRTHLNPYSSNIDSDIALIRPVALTAYQKCDTQKKVGRFDERTLSDTALCRLGPMSSLLQKIERGRSSDNLWRGSHMHN